MQESNEGNKNITLVRLADIIDMLAGHDNTYIRSLACAHPLRLPVLENILNWLDLEGKGLDMGCGIGLPAVTAAGKGLEVTGVDMETAFLETARSIADKLLLKEFMTFVQGDAFDLEFEDAYFDWAWSMDCVNYAKGLNEQPLSEMKRVLKPGGRLILAAWSSQMLLPGYPLLEARLSTTQEGLAPFETGMDPIRHFSASARVFQRMGFENIQCKTFLRDITPSMTPEEKRSLGDLFNMRWGQQPSGLNEDDQALYTHLTDPGSDRFILTDPGYYGFFTYTVFCGTKP